MGYRPIQTPPQTMSHFYAMWLKCLEDMPYWGLAKPPIPSELLKGAANDTPASGHFSSVPPARRLSLGLSLCDFPSEKTKLNNTAQPKSGHTTALV